CPAGRAAACLRARPASVSRGHPQVARCEPSCSRAVEDATDAEPTDDLGPLRALLPVLAVHALGRRVASDDVHGVSGWLGEVDHGGAAQVIVPGTSSEVEPTCVS